METMITMMAMTILTASDDLPGTSLEKEEWWKMTIGDRSLVIGDRGMLDW